MQLFKSLFCLQGFDTRMRFFVICASAFLLFILFSNALSQHTLLSLIISISLTGIIALSTQRRLRDSALNSNWILAPTLSFFLVSLIIIFSQHSSSYWLLLIPALCSAILLTYRSRIKNNATKRTYILGYFGPVDLREHQQKTTTKSSRRRIEPSLHQGIHSFDDDLDNEEHIEQPINYSSYTNEHEGDEKRAKQTDIGEIIRLKLLSGKNAKITIYSGLALAFAAFAISLITSNLNTDNSNNPVDNKETVINNNAIHVDLGREHQLNMPDGFTLYFTKHQGLVISWQADEVSNGVLWSQTDINGDKSCKNISFTPRKNKNKDNFRPLTVEVENSSDYFATFSPLDTKDLVQSLAFRGKFSLCGYSFSLKGSQAALGKNKIYADLVDY